MRVRWVRLLLLMCSTLACGEEQSVCEEAIDKLKACDVGRVEAEQGYVGLPLVISTDDCSGRNECLAECVTSATCAEIINGVKGGSSTDPNEPPVPRGFINCVYACIE
jgi:hypothetical protein